MTVSAFFAYARERHFVYLRRAAGLPRADWTTDPVLSTYRFCNVYRELDRTTVWFRENVRDRLKTAPEVLLATVLFRWFNRIQTGEAIFSQKSLIGGPATAWESHLNHSDGRGGALGDIRMAVRAYCGRGPYVTGSYIIKTPDGRDKLDGVLWCIDQFVKLEKRYEALGTQNPVGWRELAEGLLADRTWDDPLARWGSLEGVWQWLCQFPYMGGFMAAQIVADVKYTSLLDRAPDWHTFAASGPGSRKGLSLVLGRDADTRWRESDWRGEILQLREKILPMFRDQGWEEPHAQDVQNMCCEFTKYSRGYSRGVFR